MVLEAYKAPFHLEIKPNCFICFTPWYLSSCGLIGMEKFPYTVLSLSTEECEKIKANLIYKLEKLGYKKIGGIPNNIIFNTPWDFSGTCFAEVFNVECLNSYINTIHMHKNNFYMGFIRKEHELQA